MVQFSIRKRLNSFKVVQNIKDPKKTSSWFLIWDYMIDKVRIVQRLEFAYLCITLQWITPSLGYLIKLPLLPITSQPSLLVLPLYGLKIPWTLSPILVWGACRLASSSSQWLEKRTCVMLPNIKQRLHNKKLITKWALGGRQIDKTPTT